MSRPTKFEIMRARRPAKPKVEVLIDEVEAEVDRLWEEMRREQVQERQQRFDNTADWKEDTLKQAREREQVKTEPEPGTVRVLLHMLRSLPRAVFSKGARCPLS
jgi:hypothetical protein